MTIASPQRRLSIKNIRFRTKIWISLLSVLLVMIGLGGAMYSKLSNSQSGIEWTTHTYKVLGQLDAVMGSMVDQETGLRAFLISPDDVFLEPYRAGSAAFEDAVSQVEQLTRDNPRAQDLIRQIRDQGTAWQQNHAEAAITLARQPGSLDAARAMEISGGGKAQMDTLRSLIADFKDMETALLAERSAALDESVATGYLIVLTTTPIAVLMAILSGFMLIETTDKPLRETTKTLVKLAEGDLDVSIPEHARRDEIGEIQAALLSLRQFLHNARRVSEKVDQKQAQQEAVVDALGHGMDRMSSLDLTHRIPETLGGKPFPEEYETLRTSFNGLAETLNEVMSKMLASSEIVARQTDDLNRMSEQLSQRAETQAATLEESAAALHELVQSVEVAAQNAADAESHTRENHQIAEKTGMTVKEAMEAMDRIKKRSEEITQIISVIDDIAFQTNLLALNAGVESARAGEAGRGFSVVATEVRLLAQRSADSAKQIKSLIHSSTSEVDTGGRLVQETGSALTDIVARVGQVTERIAEISTGSKEQSAGLHEVNTGMGELDSVTQQNATMATEVLGTSTEIATAARDMLAAVQQFELSSGSAGQSFGASHFARKKVA